MAIEISEYSAENGNQFQTSLTVPSRVQPSIPVGSISAQSEPLQFDVARIVARKDCRLSFGTNPTASESSEFWPSGRIERRVLGVGTKVAAIAPDIPTFTLAGTPALNEGLGNLTFLVARTSGTGTASVGWSVSGTGSNPANAADFVGGVFPSGTVNFAAGELSKQIIVQVADDATVEPNETFQVALGSPSSGYGIAVGTAVGTIVNDDVASTPTPTPGNPTPPAQVGDPLASRMGTNLQGHGWYLGPAALTNLSFGGGMQARQADGGRAPFDDVHSSYYSADGRTIQSFPAGGASHTPHPPSVGGVRLRTTIWGTASLDFASNTKPGALASVKGTNSDGSKWIEYTIQDAWNGDYSNAHPDGVAARVGIGETSGTLTKIVTALRDEHDLTNGQLLGTLSKFRPEFVADLIADYGGLRFMDWQNTNGTIDVQFTATNRPLPGDTMYAPNKNWQKSFEDCIDLSVATNTDAYLCLSWQCDRSYVRALMAYAHANLPAGRHIKLETANEFWNYQFQLSSRAMAWAKTQPKPDAGRNWNDTDGIQAIYFAQAERHKQQMGWVTEWCAGNGVAVGETGRVRRVLAGQNATPSLCNDQMQKTGAGNFDLFASAPYYGTDANKATDKTVANIHRLMRLDVDFVVGLLAEIAGIARPYGAGITTYEANSHNTTTDLGDYDSFGKQRQIEVHTHVDMRYIFSYHVGEMFRRVPTLQEYSTFAHAGPVSRQGYFSLKDRLDSTTAESPRLWAWKRLQVGTRDYPVITVNNAMPATGKVGSILGFTPEKRFGAGYNTAYSVAFSNWRLNGSTVNPTSLGITVGQYGWSGTMTQPGTITFDLVATDASGSTPILSHTTSIAAETTYTLDYDARSAGATAVPLANEGWANSGGLVRKDGGVRDTGYGVSGANIALGSSGTEREIIVDFDGASFGDGSNANIELFHLGLGLRLVRQPDLTISNWQLQYNGGYVDNVAKVPIPTGPFSVLLRYKGGKVSAELDGSPLFAPRYYDLQAADVASARVSLSAQGLDGASKKTFIRFRGGIA